MVAKIPLPSTQICRTEAGGQRRQTDTSSLKAAPAKTLPLSVTPRLLQPDTAGHAVPSQRWYSTSSSGRNQRVAVATLSLVDPCLFPIKDRPQPLQFFVGTSITNTEKQSDIPYPIHADCSFRPQIQPVCSIGKRLSCRLTDGSLRASRFEKPWYLHCG